MQQASTSLYPKASRSPFFVNCIPFMVFAALCSMQASPQSPQFPQVLEEQDREILAIPGRLGLSAMESASFLKGDAIFLKHGVPKDVRYCPLAAYRPALAGKLAASEPRIVLETLQTMVLPPSLASASPDSPEGEAALLVLWNLIHRFSSMEGITYWSVTDNKEKVLFVRSRLVTGLKNPRELPDPRFAAIASPGEYTVVQEDSRLGRNLYRIQVTRLDNRTLELSTTNLEQLWLGIIPVMNQGGMQTRLLVELTGTRLVFYGATALNVTGAFGLDERLSESYRNRFEALYRWIAGELKKI